MLVAVLKATDGDYSHAITVVNNLVFESNVKQALTLSRTTLDWCCGGRNYYAGIHKGYVFRAPMHNGRKGNKRRKKDKEQKAG